MNPMSLSIQIPCRRKKLGPADKSSTRSVHHTQDTSRTDGCNLDAPRLLSGGQEDGHTLIEYLIVKPDLTFLD